MVTSLESNVLIHANHSPNLISFACLFMVLQWAVGGGPRLHGPPPTGLLALLVREEAGHCCAAHRAGAFGHWPAFGSLPDFTFLDRALLATFDTVAFELHFEPPFFEHLIHVRFEQSGNCSNPDHQSLLAAAALQHVHHNYDQREH